MKLLAGASGYSFKEWKGTFYPADMKPDGMLAFYSARLPTVEINNTFYRMPKTEMLENWARTAPAGLPLRDQGLAPHHAFRAAQAGRAADSVAFLYRALARSAKSAGRCCSSCRRS